MDSILYILVLSVCLTFSVGLELSLNRNTNRPTASGKRTFCGILTCTENINTSTKINIKSASRISFKTVSSLSVYKQIHSESLEADGLQRETLVASVSTDSPSMTRVANGLKIVGSLRSDGARVRVELFKRGDCHAQFSCLVRGVDSHGREAVGVASLAQQQGQGQTKLLGDGERFESSVSLQLLSSIQQLVTQSVARLEDKIGSIERGLLSKADTVDHRMTDVMEDKTERMESTLNNELSKLQTELNDRSLSLERVFQDRLLLLENRLEDKIDNANNVKRPNQKDTKVSQELDQFCVDFKTDISDAFETNGKKLQDIQEQSLGQVLQKFQTFIDNTTCLEASTERRHVTVEPREHTEHTIKDQTRAAQDKTKSVTVLSQQMKREILTSNNEVLSAIRDLESSVNNCSAQTRSGSRGIVYSPDRLDRDNRISDLDTILVLPACERWLTLPRTQMTSRYILVQARAEEGDHTFNFPHLCETSTDGGGWVVIQRRSSGNVDFNRLWGEYKTGFGSYFDDFWLGNDKIHTITSSGSYDLYVSLKYKDKTGYARYSNFRIANETENYKLSLGRYYGTSGNSLTHHKDALFSTIDRDNDEAGGNCVENNGGGWWFKNCDLSNLNGNWGAGADLGVEWTTFAQADSVSYSEMKIRLHK